MADTKALLIVTMEPPAALEDEFNDWYDTEHFPQRRAMPGFESGSRWVCLAGWPRWLALYDLAAPAALETDAYRAVSGVNSTPWSRRILARTSGRLRVVAQQVAPGAALAAAPGGVVRLLLARFPAVAPSALATLADGLRSAADALPGLRQARVFAGDAGAVHDLWLVAAFDRPVETATLSAALGAAGDIGADLFNLYAPYWRA